MQLPAKQGHAVAHPRQAHARQRQVGQGVRVKAGAVVLHAHFHAAVFVGHVHHYFRGVGVLHGIVEQLLYDAVHGNFYLRPQAAFQVGEVQVHRHSRRCDALAELLQGGAQAEIFQDTGRQLKGDGPGGLDGFVQQLERGLGRSRGPAPPFHAELGGVEQLPQAVVQGLGNALALAFLGGENG